MTTKMKTTTSLMAAGAAMLAVAGAAAQDRGRDGPFADGVLTRAEATAMAAERFAETDANADGYVSASEAEAAMDRRAARRAERTAERGDREGRRGRRGFARSGQGGDGERAEAAFARRDADEDGFVSRAEAEAAALARFDERDADGDGRITREEMRASGEGRRDRRR